MGACGSTACHCNHGQYCARVCSRGAAENGEILLPEEVLKGAGAGAVNPDCATSTGSVTSVGGSSPLPTGARSSTRSSVRSSMRNSRLKIGYAEGLSQGLAESFASPPQDPDGRSFATTPSSTGLSGFASSAQTRSRASQNSNATTTLDFPDEEELRVRGRGSWADKGGGSFDMGDGKNLILAGLRKSPVYSQFPKVVQADIAKQMEVRAFDPEVELETLSLRFVLVLSGRVTGRLKSGEVHLEQGQWIEDGQVGGGFSESFGGAAPSKSVALSQALGRLDHMSKGTRRRQSVSAVDIITDVAAGAEGCRVAIMTEEILTRALEEESVEEAMAYTRKMLLVKKVHIFRHLSEQQIDKLVKSFRQQSLSRGEFVFRQGDMGDAFYVIASGEVRVLINDTSVRTMGKNAYFGERALLFDEPRTASIEVTSNEAEFWGIDKSIFNAVISDKMFAQLKERIQLQDHSMELSDLTHVDLIGSGATAVVRLVEHKKTKTRYALKEIHKSPKGRLPLGVDNEISILKENDHPFIMYVVKTFETPKSVFMLTELITGGELHVAIRRIPTVLSRPQAQFYTGSIVLALEQLADRHIVYRDLKPENVMLDSQGYLKMIDFGISKKLPEGADRTYTLVGTPHYMAPEVINGTGHGVESDLWTLGVLHFEFVCGYLPFADELDDPQDVCKQVLEAEVEFPPEYNDELGKRLISGLLQRDVDMRLGSGDDGYDEVRNALFFRAGHSGTVTLFDKLMGRSLEPPVIPDGEEFCPPEEDIVLTDLAVEAEGACEFMEAMKSGRSQKSNKSTFTAKDESRHSVKSSKSQKSVVVSVKSNSTNG